MGQRIPSLNWLRVFEAAARTESFARAAAHLNLSAAAVSQQVKALEGQLGTPLFLRHAHSVTLTDAGRAYLPTVQQALGMLEEATESLFGAARDQPLFVQSVLLFAQGILAQGLGSFQDTHPAVRLMLSTGNSTADFQNRFSDLQIVFGNPSAFGSSYDRLIGETLYPVARPDMADRIAAPHDLLDQTLIEVATHRAGWRHVFDALHLRGAPRRLVYADNSIIAAAMAADGLGVMLARAPASDRVVASSGLVRCLSDITVAGQEDYHLIYPDKDTLRPVARAFRGWLLDHIAVQYGSG